MNPRRQATADRERRIRVRRPGANGDEETAPSAGETATGGRDPGNAPDQGESERPAASAEPPDGEGSDNSGGDAGGTTSASGRRTRARDAAGGALAAVGGSSAGSKATSKKAPRPASG